MSHDRCDILDILEESVTLGSRVAVEVDGGERFVDGVRDVVTMEGEDFAEFNDHGRFSLSAIRDATPVDARSMGAPGYSDQR